ncbi:alcohol dehydrogenase [Diaporthe helianthi]|uniref:Alcohol dehydrogenase n=1 Tax=Diaporthe helianthi TaxID=158607 RepID=A0A2P5I3T1_DIAHE|nr:alcohol dehydrogenase [Diaporthe helianthi]
MSRYAEAHVNPSGPGDARPTALQIIKDEGFEGKLKGKSIVITGTSSGIGIETARALATTGATLILLNRSLPKAKAAVADFFEPARMHLVEMDNESLESVRAAAAAVLSKTQTIDILINNAGIMAVPDRRLTRDGHEIQFGVNHLAHFLLFHLLKPALLAASTPESHSRVVIVASAAHKQGGIQASDNYDYNVEGSYQPWKAYAQSKTANIYMANEIERRYGAKGLHATSLQPGAINTNIGQYIPPEQVAAMAESMKEQGGWVHMKSVEQGAATTVWAAIGAEWATEGGKYLDNCAVATPAAEGEQSVSAATYAPWAYDEDKAARLWKDSLKIVGLEDTE